jgi:hypothetical protein
MLSWLLAGLTAIGPTPTPPPTPKLTNISTVEHFRNRFNAAAGKVRLVLLLSPT